MKICASMRFGGQLIEAADCDYDSFQKYGLICPNCKNSVFLVKGGIRSFGDKSIDILPYFSHFKANKDLGETCELRINNYTDREIESARSIARNQRLKFFRKWFWHCVRSSNLPGEELSLGAIIDKSIFHYKASNYYQINMDKAYDRVKCLCKNPDFRKNVLNGFTRMVQNENHQGILSPHLKKLLKKLRSKLDFKMHEQIVDEAIDYVLTAMNRHMATGTIGYSLIQLVKDGVSSELIFSLSDEITEKITYYFVASIYLINWAQEFEDKYGVTP